MDTILFLNACIRGGESRTLRLAKAALARLEGQVRTVDLGASPLRPLDRETLDRRTRWVAAGDYGHPLFDAAKAFAAADVIVIAAPYWDLSFPSCLRVYLEHIMVGGVTFRYTPQGVPQGLCRAKRLLYLSTAGGPVPGANAGYEYVRQLAQSFWGIPDVRLFQAQGLDIVGADAEGLLADALAQIANAL